MFIQIMNTDMDVISNNIINTLIKLNKESQKKDIDPNEFGKIGFAITYILNKVEDDFGKDKFLEIFKKTNTQLGHTLGPLNISIIKKLVSLGFEIKQIKRGVKYQK